MSPSLKPIEDQVIVITNAGSPIGLATARAAAARGARLAVTVDDVEIVPMLVDRLATARVDVLVAHMDPTDRAQIKGLAEAACAHFGRIDTWINQGDFPALVTGSLVALPFLRRQGGALVNVGSEAPVGLIPFGGLYVATGFATEAFTDALRLELEADADQDVAVTLIHAADDPQLDHERVARAILDGATPPEELVARRRCS